MDEDLDICDECEQRRLGDVTFHLLYCYDVYIVSPPYPQSTKQRDIDIYLYENIVKPLEQKGYQCYYGSRNITGGSHIIQAMSHPITIIPTTIVPVFKDKKFSNLRNLLLRPDYLERILFLLFDNSQVYPDTVAKSSCSLPIHDPYLLPKLIQTMEQNRRETPLLQRKIKYEMGPYPASSVSSITSDMGIKRNSRSSLLDVFRIGRLFQGRDRMDSHSSRSLHEEDNENGLSSQIQMQQLKCSSTSSEMDHDTCLEDLKTTTSPDVFLSHCHHYDEKISHFAARSLTKIIQKSIGTFYRNTNLLKFETEVRIRLEKDYMRNCEMNSYFEKLYFWILAAIYIRIYKCNDSDLKYHLKALTMKWYRPSSKPLEQLYQSSYLKITNSMIARIKSWPKQLEKNDAHVQMLENCISLLDQNDFKAIKNSTDMNTVVKYLIQLPCDVKHIFVVIITEKIFEKKYTEPCMLFFSQICVSVRDKHQEMYLDVVERAIEYIQENYTKGALTLSLKLLSVMWDLLKDGKRTDEKLMTILKHFFKKLVYHPVSDVRNFVTPLLFSEDVNGLDISQLGNSCITVNEDLLETCIREKLSLDYPDMVLHELIPTTAENVLLFDATMPDGYTLVHVFRQKTLNDILQTNSTDSAYERFQEISRAVAVCQGHRNIVTLKNSSSNGVLPLFMVEHGKPLLQFLHEYENRLTLSQMVGILIDIASSVQHCHKNKIFLCDITPASFIITSGPDGFLRTKLSAFLYSKSISHMEVDPLKVYMEEYQICVDGEYMQPLAAYFSAPETLKRNVFYEYSEVWMVAATFYSVLLYGRQPYEELSHLNTSLFVREITSHHTPQIPGYLLPDLWKIISNNLKEIMYSRMPMQSILEELDILNSTLGTKGDEMYFVKSICRHINPEDIQMVYRDLKGNLIVEKEKGSPRKKYRDCCTRKDRLFEVVSVRMGQKTKKAIKTLSHINILPVEEITTHSYTTKLVSAPFGFHYCILKRYDCNINLDQLLSYFEQIVTAMQYLHCHNILHCDLRCNYLYIDPIKGTLKLGHFGRAVLLEKNQNYVLKIMPFDALPWSAHEVKTNGMYSQASDIFNLASVLWEALHTQNKLIPSLQDGSKLMYENLEEPTDSWQYCINKLMDCMKECWNINPTKRPTLNYIGNVIKQLRQKNQMWPAEKTSTNSFSSEEVIYEDVATNSHNLDSSIDYAWKSVIYELETEMVKTTDEDEQIDCSRARKHRAFSI